MVKGFNWLPPWRLLLTSFGVTVITYFPIGFHHCVLNVTHDALKPLIGVSHDRHSGGSRNLTDAETEALWSMTVSSWQIGALIGALNAFWIADRIGRVSALTLVAGGFQLVASIFMILAVHFEYIELFITGRLFSGVGAGLVTITLRVFLSESSPDKYRGITNSFAEFILATAIVVATSLGLPQALGDAASEFKLQVLFGFCLPFNICQMAAYPFLPETPKFLYLTKAQQQQAQTSVTFYHGNESKFQDVFDELEEERRMAGGQSGGQLSFFKALRLKAVRLPLILAVVSGICDSSMGVDLFDNYGAGIFEGLGMGPEESKIASILFNVAELAGAIVSIVIIDRVRRRPLLLSMLLLILVLNIVLLIVAAIGRHGLRYYQKGTNRSFGITAVVLIALMEMAFSIGPGTILEALFTETSPHRVRAVAGSISEGCNMGSKWLFVIIYPNLNHQIGPYSFLMHIIPLTACIIYFFIYLPETGGESVAHIVDDMVSGKSDRKVKSALAAPKAAEAPRTTAGDKPIDSKSGAEPKVGETSSKSGMTAARSEMTALASGIVPSAKLHSM